MAQLKGVAWVLLDEGEIIPLAFGRQALARKPLRVERGGAIPFAAVAEHGRHSAPWPELAGELDRAHHVERRRRSNKQSFVPQQVVGHLDRLAIVAAKGSIHDSGAKVGRPTADPNAVDETRTGRCKLSGLHEALEAGAGRIDEEGGAGTVDRLEEARDASNRTACAGRTHEAVQCLPALPPELGARRAIVGVCIGNVFELVGQHGALGGLGDRVGPRAVGAWVGKGHARALRDGGPQDPEQLLLIVADVLGDR